VSRTYEACTSLTLEVSARVTSLEAALQRFAAVERLDGDNKQVPAALLCCSVVARFACRWPGAGSHLLESCDDRLGCSAGGLIAVLCS